MSGGTAAECVLLSAAFPASLLLRHALALLHPPPRLAALLDVLCLALAPLAALLRPQHAPSLLAALSGPPLLALAHTRLSAPPPVGAGDTVRQAVDAYRAGLMLLTCAAILGVDFAVFPRRLAKSETYGTGLMDLGPGAFVFATGAGSGQAPKHR